MPLYFAVSSKGSITFKENYFGSLSGKNGECKIMTLFLLIVCENNRFGIWSAGYALAKAVLAHVCSLSQLHSIIPPGDTVSVKEVTSTNNYVLSVKKIIACYEMV